MTNSRPLARCFSILIGSSGGSSITDRAKEDARRCFSILIGSSGGSSLSLSTSAGDCTRFQYPHRIVGGFKVAGCSKRPRHHRVSVSSSDRRGVQVCPQRVQSDTRERFSILIGSSGGSRPMKPICSRATLLSFSILIGSSGGSSKLKAPNDCMSRRFSILIGSSGGSSLLEVVREIEELCFSILIGSSGGSRMWNSAWRHRHICVSVSSSDRRGVQVHPVNRYLELLQCFSILIGSSGGSSTSTTEWTRADLMFQYPHRIVGGFKLDVHVAVSLRPAVSVSSSDRRGVQVRPACANIAAGPSFSILIGSSGGSSSHKIILS